MILIIGSSDSPPCGSKGHLTRPRASSGRERNRVAPDAWSYIPGTEGKARSPLLVYYIILYGIILY